MKTLKHLLSLISLVLASISLNAQSTFLVDTIQLIETVDHRYVSYLPKLSTTASQYEEIVDKINTEILDRFMIQSFDSTENEDFRWYDAGFDTYQNDSILYIAIYGTYYGAYPNDVTDELIFNLKTGETLHSKDIRFYELFSPQGYLNFFNKYWAKEIKIAFQEATECAESEPYCSIHSIEYSMEGNKLNVYLASDCYPRVIRSCSPYHSIDISIDSLKPYLSEQGKKILIKDKYPTLNGLSRYLYNVEYDKGTMHNLYLFGDIDSKYPITMALTINQKTKKIEGFYYYNKKLQNIALKGSIEKGTIHLQEYVGKENTGSFQFNIDEEYHDKKLMLYFGDDLTYYLNGTWSNPQKTKLLNINFTGILIRKNLGF